MKLNKWIIPLYTCSLIFPLSSSSWLNIWIGLEINLMMFILILNKKKSTFMSESTMKYFLIQASSSLIFLLSMSMNMTYYNEWPLIWALVPPLALMMKMGIAPIHMWVVETAKNFCPHSLFLFLTLQKVNPLMIIYSSWSSIVFLLSLINVMVGSIMGINESSMNKMLISSSISNSGWMICSLTISNLMFLITFCTYMILLFNLMLVNSYLKIKWVMQMKSNSIFKKTLMYSTFMSMSGLPPFLGFVPKWMMIKEMIMFIPFYTWMFIIFSSLNLFFYMKSSLMMMMTTQENKKWLCTMIFSYKYIITTAVNMMGIPMFSMLM
uniref:NADH dehydrogenase subunit 2 n=1 Tax=Carsidara limbata TaxID=2591562 RepID=UPI0030034587|nr:NADH dehydrogenase subunit 2 [Carsidara limbata]